MQLPTDTGAGQEGLGNHSSFPELALTEQTLAVLALAGIAAYFWKLLRLPGMEPPSFTDEVILICYVCCAWGFLLMLLFILSCLLFMASKKQN